MAITKKTEAPTRSIEIIDHLSEQEETILRFNGGVEVKADIHLKRKTRVPALLARLEQLEREIIERAKTKGIIN